MLDRPFGEIEIINQSKEEIDTVIIEEFLVETKSFAMSTARLRFKIWAFMQTPKRKPSIWTVRELTPIDRGGAFRAVVVIAHGDETRLQRIAEAI